VQNVHERNGVVFKLGTTVTKVDHDNVQLQSGETIPAQLVVAGVGVRPSIEFAEANGINCDRGILVDVYLETNIPDVYAAGDVARWRDRRTGSMIRVEHWVFAERQGKIAAENMLAANREERQEFNIVPFFWSAHFDSAISYVGHAEKWDSADFDAAPETNHFNVRYKQGDQLLAVATVGDDMACLRAERELEQLANAPAT
jgi:NADPH-dependent 2,4-dienoyl-CoA reductase/sulfur reductase-like enzyme